MEVPRFRIEPERSRVWIDGRSTLHPIHSTTGGLEGFIELDVSDDGAVAEPASPAGGFTLPVAGFASGNSLEDRELHRRIDTRRFPTIEGVVTDMKRIDDSGRYRVSGELAFRGITKPLRGRDDRGCTRRTHHPSRGAVELRHS